MGLYLAYEIDENKLTMAQLERIMTDWFDFPIMSRHKNFKEWLESAKKGYLREIHCGDSSVVEAWANRGYSPLTLATFCGPFPNSQVKDHPLLEIQFCHNHTWYYSPKDFTGLNIHTKHSGSEGIIDLIRFKPEMDRYLALQRILHLDLSVIEL